MDFRVIDTNGGDFFGISRFLNLFGDITNSSKGDTIVSNGSVWEKSKQRNIFINHKGDTGDIVLKIINKSNPPIEYILNIKGYVKFNEEDIKIDLSYIVKSNVLEKGPGFNLGNGIFTYNISNNIINNISNHNLTVFLSETCIYSLEFKTFPYIGKIDNLQIQIDTTDKSKYLCLYLNFYLFCYIIS